MKTWRARLSAFSWIYLLVCGWVPPLWYMQWLHAKYKTDLFAEIATVPELILSTVLLVVAFAATVGLILDDKESSPDG